MASERQIAANRRNARKSTGPRSSAGKRWASRNAFRHGLSLSLTAMGTSTEEITQLARKIVGDTADAITMMHGLTAAEAELEIARVRRAKAAIINRLMAFESLDPGKLFNSPREAIRAWTAITAGKPLPERAGVATMPSDEPQRSTEAIRRALPELLKLDRYEQRARSRRHRAVREIARGR